MKTDVKHEKDIAIVSVSESVDALTAGELTKVISAQITNEHADVIVDLTQVEFMSSAGLRTLLGAVKESRSNGGDLRIASSNPGVDKVLKMSGFHNIAKVFETQTEALASFE